MATMKIQDKTPPEKMPPEKTPPEKPITPPLRPTFEHCSRKLPIEGDHGVLAQMGSEGWELVTAVPIPHDPGAAIYHFKRARRV